MWDIEGKLTKTQTRAEGVPPAAINMSHLVVRWLGGEGDMVRVTKWKMRLYLPLIVRLVSLGVTWVSKGTGTMVRW